MKIKLILLPSILILAPTAFLLFTHQERAFGQNAPPEAKTRTLPKQGNQGAVSKILVDDRLIPNPKAGMVAMPDLTIKTMCIEYHRKEGYSDWESLKVLLANIGSLDAGFFELGIVFTFSFTDPTSGDFAIDQVYGLKAGEERWLDETWSSGGWGYTVDAVKGSVKFQVIADPKYCKWNGSAFGGAQPCSTIMPRILESNAKNNELTLNKSELKHCPLPQNNRSNNYPKMPPVGPKKP